LMTRCLGGSGGTCGAKNKLPRKRCNAARGNCQGLMPSSVMLPTTDWPGSEHGAKAQAITCSKVVLPAPDGPMIATCSPLATVKSTARIALGEPSAAAGCLPETLFSAIFTRKVYFNKPAARAADSMPL